LGQSRNVVDLGIAIGAVRTGNTGDLAELGQTEGPAIIIEPRIRHPMLLSAKAPGCSTGCAYLLPAPAAGAAGGVMVGVVVGGGGGAAGAVAATGVNSTLT